MAPTITPELMLSALLADGVVTEQSLIALLGDKRHAPTLNVIEQAIVRDHVLSRSELLAVKGRISGRPTLTDPDIKPTAHLAEQTAKRAGAIVLARNPLTVAMVEDTEQNLEMVAAAIQTREFDVWLVTVGQFAELYATAYRSGSMDQRGTVPDLFTILDDGIRQRASDIHIKTGIAPSLRVDGSIVQLPYEPLSHHWIRAQVERIAEPRHIKDLDDKHSTDFAYSFGAVRFRVNVAYDADGHTMVLRKLPSKIPSYDDLGAPEAIRRFSELERGLVLVTGPTGSGKSTTLAAILNDVITNSSRHVITLEDPIEFRFPIDRRSLVNQRELNSSFATFPDGIRDALRQDPDVVLVGEMRDTTTIKAALTAAETGHFVLGTLHTMSAASTVSRVVNSFPTEEQDAIRVQMAQMLKGVVSQTLLPRAATKGRVAAYEILVSTPAIATNLRKVGGENALKQTMQTATAQGMQTMEQSLAALVHSGIVSEKEAEFRAQDTEEFQRQLQFFSSR